MQHERYSRQELDLLTMIIQENEGIPRSHEPVTVGVPFPKECIHGVGDILLADDHGEVIPWQGKVLARWSDGSVKWLLIDFTVSIASNDTREYRVMKTQPQVGTQQDVRDHSLHLRRAHANWIVNTHAEVFEVLSNHDTLFRMQCTQDQNHGEQTMECRALLTDDNGREYHARALQLDAETDGPLRAVICTSGAMADDKGSAFCDFHCRLSFFAGTPSVLLNFSLTNPRAAIHPGGLWDLGDPSSLYFKDLSLLVTMIPQTGSTIWWSSGEGDHTDVLSGGPSIEIYQDSSGGEQWRSVNHVNRKGRVPVQFRGYRVMQGGEVIREGLRAQPVVSLRSRDGCVSAGIRAFWQNFPKALEARPDGLTLRLFPKLFGDVFELQGGERKTHQVLLSFAKEPNHSQISAWLQKPLQPRCPPEWYEKCRVFSYFCVSPWDEKGYLDSWIATIVEGPNSFLDRRESVDEYGWRNYGDCFADHEAMGYKGVAPLVSHYNNQYDLIHSFLIQYARRGDVRWFTLASDLARHVMDIDIYHTEEDRYVYNKGLFWHTNHFMHAATATHRCFSQGHVRDGKHGGYGGGPSMDNNYTSGLLQYYYMTGDHAACDAVLDLAGWVLHSLEGPSLACEAVEVLLRDALKLVLGRLRPGGKGLYPYGLTDGPGRASGNALNVLLDGFQLTGLRKYLLAAERLICMCINPDDDIPSRELLNAEFRWMYLIFLQALCKYLDHKAELGEHDAMYAYGRLSLLHYAEWMHEHEYPYLDRPEELDQPNFATRAAQDLRKCNVLLIASQYAAGPLGERFRERADFFFKRSLDSLGSLDTRFLTRPLAVLMLNGGVHEYIMGNMYAGWNNNIQVRYEDPVTLRQPRLDMVKRGLGIVRSLFPVSIHREIQWLKRRFAEVRVHDIDHEIYRFLDEKD